MALPWLKHVCVLSPFESFIVCLYSVGDVNYGCNQTEKRSWQVDPCIANPSAVPANMPSNNVPKNFVSFNLLFMTFTATMPVIFMISTGP